MEWAAVAIWIHMTPEARNRSLKLFVKMYDDPGAYASALKKKWLALGFIGFACVMFAAVLSDQAWKVALLLSGGMFLGLAVSLRGSAQSVSIVTEFSKLDREAVDTVLAKK